MLKAAVDMIAPVDPGEVEAMIMVAHSQPHKTARLHSMAMDQTAVTVQEVLGVVQLVEVEVVLEV